MAGIYTPLAALSPRKKDLKVIICVANMWIVPDKYRLHILTFMNLLLVNDQIDFTTGILFKLLSRMTLYNFTQGRSWCRKLEVWLMKEIIMFWKR
ncbi:hypothetical protein P8452_63510 [Trifolium repens]|nr:hypothetical protein P8452_63510 [Trifolium repens]